MMKLYRLFRPKRAAPSSSIIDPAGAMAKDADADAAIASSRSIDPNLGRLSSQDAKELERVFRSIDTDGDGRICLDELRAMLRSLGNANPDDTQLLGLLREIDTDGDGFISLEEFVQVNQNSCCTEELRAAFRIFDIDGNGFISADELHKVMVRLGDKISRAECKRMISGVDSDGNGLVDFEEFKLMMAPRQQQP